MATSHQQTAIPVEESVPLDVVLPEAGPSNELSMPINMHSGVENLSAPKLNGSLSDSESIIDLASSTSIPPMWKDLDECVRELVLHIPLEPITHSRFRVPLHSTGKKARVLRSRL